MDLNAETDPKCTESQTQSTPHNQINTTQTCWNTALVLHGKSNGKKKKKTFDVDLKKKVCIASQKDTVSYIQPAMHSSKCTVAVHV